MSSTDIVFPKIENARNSVTQQRFAVVLFFHVGGIIKYFSVACVSRTNEFAVKRAKIIAQQIEINKHPISMHVVPIGLWNSININFKELVTSYNPTEANNSLNNLMKCYLAELENESNVQKERKEKALDSVANGEGKVVTGKYYDPNIGIEKAMLNTVIDKEKEDLLLREKEEGATKQVIEDEEAVVEEKLPVEENTTGVEYLSIDKVFTNPIKEANFFAIQFLTIESFPVECREKYADQKYFGFKIKGFYEDEKSAEEGGEYFNKKDKFYDTPICPMCEWGPFGYDINTVSTEKGIIYQEKPLNEFMQVVHEKELLDRKKEEIERAEQEGGEERDEEEEYENERRNKLVMQQEENKNIIKQTPEEILEAKLASVRAQKEDVKKQLDKYEKSKEKLDPKLAEIEGLFAQLQKE